MKFAPSFLQVQMEFWISCASPKRLRKDFLPELHSLCPFVDVFTSKVAPVYIAFPAFRTTFEAALGF